jgi:hypothetical protein
VVEAEAEAGAIHLHSVVSSLSSEHDHLRAVPSCDISPQVMKKITLDICRDSLLQSSGHAYTFDAKGLERELIYLDAPLLSLSGRVDIDAHLDQL